MPFDRATLTQVDGDALQDIASSLIYDSTTGELASPSQQEFTPLSVLAMMTAGGVYSAYGYIDWLALQAVPWTATDEFALGWGALKGVTPKLAQTASGTQAITGPPLTDIPSGTQISGPGGILYATTTDVILDAAGQGVISFTALLSGPAANAAIGATLTFTSPFSGIPARFIAASPISGGTPDETPTAYKTRYLARYAAPPSGGSAADYVAWASDVPGVTRAWCAPNGFGAGSVVIYTMFDTANAAAGGFPQGTNGVAAAEPRDVAATGDQRAVADFMYPLRPVTALVYSCAPIATPVPFTLANLGANNTVATLAAIRAALTAMFLDQGDPRGQTLYPNAWENALATVAGLTQYTLVAPVAPIVATPGQLLTLGLVSTSA